MQSTNKPILLIYTGGTIGMQPSEHGYQPSNGFEQLLTENLSQNSIQHLAPFDIIEFEKPIDSSNAKPDDWYSIATCISENYHQYSAFIVLHGTDTMAYTGAALTHLLGENIKPVIVTGSQIPLSQSRSDGTTNLQDAIAFCRDGKLAQVAICFGGKLLDAKTATKSHSSHFAAFDSPNHPPLATTGIDLTYNQALLKPASALKQSMTLPANQPKNNRVEILHLHPCISDAVIEATLNAPEIQAVILLSYGAGNPPDENQALMSALRTAKARGVVVFNKSQCYAGAVAQGSYAVGSALAKLGVISAGKRTLEDLVTDLHFNAHRYQQPIND